MVAFGTPVRAENSRTVNFSPVAGQTIAIAGERPRGTRRRSTAMSVVDPPPARCSRERRAPVVRPSAALARVRLWQVLPSTVTGFGRSDRLSSLGESPKASSGGQPDCRRIYAVAARRGLKPLTFSAWLQATIAEPIDVQLSRPPSGKSRTAPGRARAPHQEPCRAL
jgi:hypothetical protein